MERKIICEVTFNFRSRSIVEIKEVLGYSEDLDLGLRETFSSSSLMRNSAISPNLVYYDEFMGYPDEEEVKKEILEYLEEVNFYKLLDSLESLSSKISEKQRNTERSYRVRMVKEGAPTEYALPSTWAKLINDGYVPASETNRKYPIVSSKTNDIFVFTIYEDEIDSYEAEGRTVVKF